MKPAFETAIIIKNKTRLEMLTERFSTKASADFYITQQQQNFYSKAVSFKKKTKAPAPKAIKQTKVAPEIKKGEGIAKYEAEHNQFYKVLQSVQKQLDQALKTKIIEQDFLPSYVFAPHDLIVVVGQDGLVANTAKYVGNQPIVAINPNPDIFDGVLLPFTEFNFMPTVWQILQNNYSVENITLAEAELNDGQKLLAFNDFFIGPKTHSSARYRIDYREHSENQSSSGIIVSTGAGSTGWLSSLFNMANGIFREFTSYPNYKYQPISRQANQLVFVVREPFISKTSKAGIVAGNILADEEIIIESFMPEEGIIFSDGIQKDFLDFNSGAIATIRIAEQKARLVKKLE